MNCTQWIIKERVMKQDNFFDSTLKLFTDYRGKMIKQRQKDYNGNLSNEVYHRLRQLSFICEKVHHYEQIVTNPEVSLSKSTTEEVIELGELFDEGIVYAEAFYFFAWRIILIADHHTNPLPGLKGLKDKAKGVRTVRNSLIVHPEGENILMLSFSWGSEGPRLKTARPPGDTFEITDRGFWVNAQEFKDVLEELLQKAIQ